MNDEIPAEVDLCGGHRGVYYRRPALVYAASDAVHIVKVSTMNTAWPRTRIYVTERPCTGYARP